jgi:hypothetical protein
MERLFTVTARLLLALITALGTWLPVNAIAVTWLGHGPVTTLLSLTAAAAGAWAGATADLTPLEPRLAGA